ncbi:hypothetical protein BaRGS_00030531 [Batillaria attramentaria]|uniref:Uncharacterized protein n=1 Tax=Batillaria attramentaria TaxID=370345 RepID=A0ABD0JUS0_9CAEN
MNPYVRRSRRSPIQKIHFAKHGVEMTSGRLTNFHCLVCIVTRGRLITCINECRTLWSATTGKTADNGEITRFLITADRAEITSREATTATAHSFRIQEWSV